MKQKLLQALQCKVLANEAQCIEAKDATPFTKACNTYYAWWSIIGCLSNFKFGIGWLFQSGWSESSSHMSAHLAMP